MYDWLHGTWFLRVIMSSSCALFCSLSVKKQKHDFQVCFVDWARHRKIVEDKDSQTQKGRGRWQRPELFADYVKEEELREPEEKKELAQTLKTLILCPSRKERIRSIYNETIDSVFVISKIIKVSVRVSRRLRLITPTLISGYHKNLNE